MNPDELIRKTYGNRKLLGAVVAVVLGYAAWNLLGAVWAHRDGIVTADPTTYLLFARNLASGHFYLDGPLADGIAAFSEHATLAQGPIWNTNVRPDGRTLFTVAIGYPLFLATVLKTAGMWACLHVNALLLATLLVLLVWAVWEGLDRTPSAAIVGGLAAILLVRSQPTTFLQFMDPWREPLFFCCLVGGVVGLLRFLRSGRLLPLLVAGFLLGFACCIKEANGLYSCWLGLYFLASRRFREHPQRFTALACFAGAGLVGLLPLLVQNQLGTGEFYRSLQFARATSQYSVAEAGAGVSGGNFMRTVLWYVNIYRHHWLFSPGFLAIGVVGAVVNLRYPLIRMLAGTCVLHLALYLQWGSADFRHMYFAHIPYAVFLAAAVFWMVRRVMRKWGVRDLFVPWILVLPLLGAAVWPAPWPSPPKDGHPMRFRDARALTERIDGLVQGPALILSNRILRDVLATHSRHAVARLVDVARFHPADDAKSVLQYYLERGFEVLFLDNVDLDPRNVGIRDWSRQDRKRLLAHFDLVEVDRVSGDRYGLTTLLKEESLTVYRVVRWSRTEIRRTISTDSGEPAAFLWVSPRSVGEALQVCINGQELPEIGYPFVPLDSVDAGARLEVFAKAGGAFVPTLTDLRAVDWTEPIRLTCGADALPDDGFLYPEPPGESPGGDFRYFEPDIRLRLPVRTRPDLFTTVGLGVAAVGTATGYVNVTVQQFDEPERPVKVAGGKCYFPVLVATNRPYAGPVDVTIRTRPGLRLKLSRVVMFSSIQRFERDVPPDGHGVALAGFLTPRAWDEGPHAWRVDVNGELRARGHCLDDPGRHSNLFELVLTDETVRPRYEVVLTGAGLIKPEWIDIGPRLQVEAGDPAAVLWDEGFHPVEGEGPLAFRWTEGKGRVKVPVAPRATSYRVELDLLDGHPGEAARALELQLGEVTTSLTLPKHRSRVTAVLTGVRVEAKGLADLSLSCDPWVPSRILPRSNDHRRLGFQLYGIRWERIGTDFDSDKDPPAD